MISENKVASKSGHLDTVAFWGQSRLVTAFSLCSKTLSLAISFPLVNMFSNVDLIFNILFTLRLSREKNTQAAPLLGAVLGEESAAERAP